MIQISQLSNKNTLTLSTNAKHILNRLTSLPALALLLSRFILHKKEKNDGSCCGCSSQKGREEIKGMPNFFLSLTCQW